MTEEPNTVERFRNASSWFGAHFLAPLSCSAAEAEQKLGIRFPAAYLELVVDLKSQGIRMGDIVDSMSEHFSLTWPKRLVPFFVDGGSNYYCFDSATNTPEGEPPIVFWDHEMNREENLLYPSHYVGTFASWVSRYSKEEVPDKPPRRFAKLRAAGCVVMLCALVFLSVVGAVTVVRWFWQWER